MKIFVIRSKLYSMYCPPKVFQIGIRLGSDGNGRHTSPRRKSSMCLIEFIERIILSGSIINCTIRPEELFGEKKRGPIYEGQ